MKKYISIYFVLLTIFLVSNIPICIAQGIWTYYTDELPGIVFDMTQDKYGNYWFATDNGVCRLDTNGIWHILVDTTVLDSTYFKRQIVIDKENNKWFVGVAMSNRTKEYVVNYDDSTFTYYNPSGKEKETWIQSLGVDSTGHIWAGSMANWAYWFDGTQWHPFFVSGTTLYDPILAFAVDRRGKVYIGHTNGISTIDGYLWGEFVHPVWNFAFDKNNWLWFGTSGMGLGVYDGENVTLYTTDDGLLSNSTSVVIDSSYNFWVSYSRLVKTFTRFNGIQWTHHTFDNIIGDDALAWYVDKKGAIWFRSIDGLSVYLDTTTTEVERQHENSAFPETFILYQNFPNPFNPETSIAFELSKPSQVEVIITNLSGNVVKKIELGNLQTGRHQVKWSGETATGAQATTGVYFYQIQAGKNKQTGRMLLIK